MVAMYVSVVFILLASGCIASQPPLIQQPFPLSAIGGTDGGVNGMALHGANNEQSGTFVSEAGDVNADGFDDFLIGTLSSNSAYLLFGSATTWNDEFGELDLGSMDGFNGVRIVGEILTDNFGSAVSGAGDVNKDGWDDFLIGAWGRGSQAGSAYLFFGAPAATWEASEGYITAASLMDGIRGVELQGIDADDFCGFSVSGVGDVDADSYDDFVVGASGGDASGPESGEVYLVFGQAAGEWMAGGGRVGIDALMDGLHGVVLEGGTPGESAGMAVSPAGDVNGDLVPDFLVGAPLYLNQNGAAYLLFGHATAWHMSNTFALSSLDGTRGVRMQRSSEALQAGFAVASAGDVNGDGLGDFLIGAPLASDFPSYAYLLFGHATEWTSGGGTLDLSTLDGIRGVELRGEHSFGRNGNSVSYLGDLNHDGYDEFLIGARDGNDMRAGRVYVIFGADSTTWEARGGLVDIITLRDGVQAAALEGVNIDDRTGCSVSGLGDVNGDGVRDFVVGAFQADWMGKDTSGVTYLMTFGGTFTGPPLIPSPYPLSNVASSGGGVDGMVLLGATAGDKTGFSVREAGDVNADGFDDFLVGMVAGNRVYLLFGSATTWRDPSGRLDLELPLNGINGVVLEGIAAGDNFGFSVSGAGDVNNDGWDDFLVGARLRGGNIGSAYLFFGAPAATWEARGGLISASSLLDGTHGVELAGAGGGDFFGSALSGVGDLDADGYADFVIGAHGGASGFGEVSLVFGQESAVWKAGGGSVRITSLTDGIRSVMLIGGTDDGAGISISGAGDVNGDGFPDFLVGAFRSGATDGAAYLLFGHASAWRGTRTLGLAPSIFDLTLVDSTLCVMLQGIAGGKKQTGFGTASAGDVNGDGFGDFLVGAPQRATGSAYLLFGHETAWTSTDGTFALSSLNGTRGIELVGTDAGDQNGVSASHLGDLNADGYDEFLIGARAGNSGGGLVYVVFGADAGTWEDMSGPVALNTLTDGFQAAVLQGAPGENAGGSVWGVGDVNGDGVPDFLVGAPIAGPGGKSEAGQAYLVTFANRFMAPTPPPPPTPAPPPVPILYNTLVHPNLTITENLDPTVAFEFQPSESVYQFGSSLASMGDFTGAGPATVCIGGGILEYNGIECYLGSASHYNVGSVSVEKNVSFVEVEPYQMIPFHVGDFNGDGKDEIGVTVVLPPGNDRTVVLVHGLTLAELAEYEESPGSGTVNIESVYSGSMDGIPVDVGSMRGTSSVSFTGLGDIGGDGKDDVLIVRGGDGYIFHGRQQSTERVEVSAFCSSVLPPPQPMPPTHFDVEVAVLLSSPDAASTLAFANHVADVASGVLSAGPSVDAASGDTLFTIQVTEAKPPLSSLAQTLTLGYNSSGVTVTGLLKATTRLLCYQFHFTVAATANSSPPYDVVGSVVSLLDHPTDGVVEAEVDGDSLPCGGAKAVASSSDLGVRTPGLEVRVAGEASFGEALSPAGDVNGDGMQDFLIGAPLAPGGGAVYLIFGSSEAWWDAGTGFQLSLLNGSNGVNISSSSDVGIGFSVAAAGDVNDDGIDDFIIGSPMAGVGGKAYLVFGRTNWTASIDVEVDALVIEGPGADSDFGYNVAGVGDVNNDTIDDVLISCPGAGASGVHLLFGKVGWVTPPNLQRLGVDDGVFFEGEAIGTTVGSCLAGVGDVNGDGSRDILIGVESASSAFLIFGGNWSSTVFELRANMESDGVSLFSDAGHQLGCSCSGGRDANGDGMADFVLGANRAGSSNEGVAFVLLGRSSWPLSVVLAPDDSNPQTTVIRATGVADVGFAVAMVDDMNADGLSDVLVSSHIGNGVVFLVYGMYSWPGVFDVSSFADDTFVYQFSSSRDVGLGFAVAGAGDLNGDGRPDLLLGAFSAAYVVYGRVFVAHATLVLPELFHGGEAEETKHSILDLTGLVGADGVVCDISTVSPSVFQGELQVETTFTLTYGHGGEQCNTTNLLNLLTEVARATSTIVVQSCDASDYVVLVASAAPQADVLAFSTVGVAGDVTVVDTRVRAVEGELPHCTEVASGTELQWSAEGAFPIGDVNGDGYHDFALPRSQYGFTVVWGRRMWPSSLALDDELLEWQSTMTYTWDLDGTPNLAGLGDVNGDACDDFAIAYTGGTVNGTTVCVMFGRCPAISTWRNGSANVFDLGHEVWDGVSSGACFHTPEVLSSPTVVGVGDFDGDGLGDFTLRDGDGNPHAYLLLGSAGGFTMNGQRLPTNASTNIEQYLTSGYHGLRIQTPTFPMAISAADLSEDGRNELVFGVDSIGAFGVYGRDLAPPLLLDGKLCSLAADKTHRAAFHATYGSIGEDALQAAALPLNCDLSVPFNATTGAPFRNAWFVWSAPQDHVGGNVTIHTCFGNGPAEQCDTIVAVWTTCPDESSPFRSPASVYQNATACNSDADNDFAFGDASQPCFRTVPNVHEHALLTMAYDGGIEYYVQVLWWNGDCTNTTVSLVTHDVSYVTPAPARVPYGYPGHMVSLTTLSANMFNGATRSSRAGATVSGAGDVNGDGYDDFIVGAVNQDGGAFGTAAAGVAFLMFGRPEMWASPFELSHLHVDPTVGVRLRGVVPNGHVGHSASGVGDVTGDGIEDFILGSDGAAMAYLVFGSTEPWPLSLDLSAESFNGVVFTGLNATSFVVSAAGDVNGDGVPDIAIGCPGAGTVYVVFGRLLGSPWPAEMSLTNDLQSGTSGFSISTSSGVAHECGYAVAGVGDVNADGVGDLVFGCPSAGTGGSGQAMLLFGRSEPPFPAHVDATTLDGTNGVLLRSSPTLGIRVGTSVARALGDVNGDGVDDIAIGTSFGKDFRGVVYCVFGINASVAAWPSQMLVSTVADGVNGFSLGGSLTAVPGERLGVSISSAGDVNQDGINDVLVGADIRSGRAYVLYGSEEWPAKRTTDDLLPMTSTVYTGASVGFRCGHSVALAGDVNGDGRTDMLIGCSNTDLPVGPDAGQVALIPGRTFELPSLQFCSTGYTEGEIVNVWSGQASQQWFDARNWDSGMIPEPSHNVHIAGGSQSINFTAPDVSSHVTVLRIVCDAELVIFGGTLEATHGGCIRSLVLQGGGFTAYDAMTLDEVAQGHPPTYWNPDPIGHLGHTLWVPESPPSTVRIVWAPRGSLTFVGALVLSGSFDVTQSLNYTRCQTSSGCYNSAIFMESLRTHVIIKSGAVMDLPPWTFFDTRERTTDTSTDPGWFTTEVPGFGAKLTVEGTLRLYNDDPQAMISLCVSDVLHVTSQGRLQFESPLVFTQISLCYTSLLLEGTLDVTVARGDVFTPRMYTLGDVVMGGTLSVTLASSTMQVGESWPIVEGGTVTGGPHTVVVNPYPELNGGVFTWSIVPFGSAAEGSVALLPPASGGDDLPVTPFLGDFLSVLRTAVNNGQASMDVVADARQVARATIIGTRSVNYGRGIVSPATAAMHARTVAQADASVSAKAVQLGEEEPPTTRELARLSLLSAPHFVIDSVRFDIPAEIRSAAATGIQSTEDVMVSLNIELFTMASPLYDYEKLSHIRYNVTRDVLPYSPNVVAQGDAAWSDCSDGGC